MFRFGLSFFFGIWFYVLFHNCHYQAFNIQFFFFVDLLVLAYIYIYEDTKYNKPI